MIFTPEFLDAIRARLPCSLVVGRRVKLRKAGREWSGLSPFNREKTPSFFVNDAKERWFDFSAGKNGDIFAFVMEADGLTFTESVEALAAEAGIPLPAKSYEETKRDAQRHSLIEVCKYALHQFSENLARVDEGHPAKRFLREREITSEQVERFGIGYAIGDEAGSIKAILAAHNISESQGVEAGLLIRRGDDDRPLDFFRNRLTIPIANMQGAVVGFSGRSLVGGGKPKYLNSPEGPIFDKSRLLFNSHRVRRDDTMIVVEGYTATIAADRIGVTVVATMGTSVSADQVKMMWRLHDAPVVCFDGDSAGSRAVARLIATALPILAPGRSLRFASLPNGSDPDDFIRERGAKAFSTIIDRSASMVDTLWRLVVTNRATETPEGRVGMERHLVELVRVIPDRDLRQSYIDDLKDRVRSLRRRTKVVRANGVSFHSTSPGAVRLAHGIGRSDMTLRDAMIVVACVNAPHVVADAAEHLPQTISDETRQTVDLVLSMCSSGEGHEVMENVAASYNAAMQRLHDAGITSLDPGNDEGARALLKGLRGQ